MTEYQQPKLQGHKVALMARVSPEQHRAAIEASHQAGLSMAEYIGALIDRDAGRSNKLDNREEPRLPLANSAERLTTRLAGRVVEVIRLSQVAKLATAVPTAN